MRAEDVAFIPHPDCPARRGASRPPGPLRRRVGADALEHEVVDRRFGIEAQNLVRARIDDRAHAFDRQRSLSDVRRQDDFSRPRWCERFLLRIDVERAVQRKRLQSAKIARSAFDFSRAGKEDEYIAGRRDHIVKRLVRRVFDLYWKRRRGHVEHFGVAEVAGDCGGVEGGGHHHDRQIVARGGGLFGQRDRKIGVNAALVKLVEHDDAELAEKRVALQSR